MSEPEQVTIRNSMPNIVANEAYDPDWKRTQDLVVVHTPGGIDAPGTDFYARHDTMWPEDWLPVPLLVPTERMQEVLQGGYQAGHRHDHRY